jgi:hypothetical protein
MEIHSRTKITLNSKTHGGGSESGPDAAVDDLVERKEWARREVKA